MIINISYPLPLLHTSIGKDVFCQFIHLDTNQLESAGHFLVTWMMTYFYLNHCGHTFFICTSEVAPHWAHLHISSEATKLNQLMSCWYWYMEHKQLKLWHFPHHSVYLTCSICSDFLCFLRGNHCKCHWPHFCFLIWICWYLFYLQATPNLWKLQCAKIAGNSHWKFHPSIHFHLFKPLVFTHLHKKTQQSKYFKYAYSTLCFQKKKASVLRRRTISSYELAHQCHGRSE